MTDRIRGRKKEEAKKANSPDIKVTIIGEGAVGKTSLIRRWCEGKFEKTYLETLGVDITDKLIHVDDKVFKMIMWDIAGQERYKEFRNAFYNGTQGVIIVADVTNPASFEALPSWKKELELFVDKNLPSILLVNKCDLEKERKVGLEEIYQVGKVLRIDEKNIFETSAMDGQNVHKSFESLSKIVKGL